MPVVRHGDSIYAAEVIPLRVQCCSFTRKGAIARAGEWFANLVAAYEATCRLAQLVQECECLQGPDRSTISRSPNCCSRCRGTPSG